MAGRWDWLDDEFGWTDKLSLKTQLQLQYRRGAKELLRGIPVYYDFNWRSEIGHNHPKFKYGKDIAAYIINKRPTGLKPVLVLTISEEYCFNSDCCDDLHVVIINIKVLYSCRSGTDFLANKSPTPITDILPRKGTTTKVTEILKAFNEAGESEQAELLSMLSAGQAIKVIAQQETLTPENEKALSQIAIKYPSIKQDLVDNALQLGDILAWLKAHPETRGPLLADLIDDTLQLGHVVTWLKGNPETRRALLAEMLGQDETDLSLAVELVKRNDSATLQVIQENADLVATFVEKKIDRDVMATAYRRSQLYIFSNMLYDDQYFAEVMRKQQTERQELVWQRFFTANPWIFGYGLQYEYLEELENAPSFDTVVIGSTFYQDGNRADAVLKTAGYIGNLCFVEIKHHRTRLLQDVTSPYRKCAWRISSELAGGVVQTQQIVARFLTSRTVASLRLEGPAGEPTDEEVFFHKPKAILVAGTMKEFMNESNNQPHISKLSSFEHLRSSLNTPEIITFDQLHERATHIVEARERRTKEELSNENKNSTN